MKVLLDAGCDPNYNGTSMRYIDMFGYSGLDYYNDDYLYHENGTVYDYYYEYDKDEDDYYEDVADEYISGITILHMASQAGSTGDYSKTK